MLSKNIFLVILLTALPSTISYPCSIPSISGHQLQNGSVMISWAFQGSCNLFTYTIRYYDELYQNINYYQSGRVTDKYKVIHVSSCRPTSHSFVFVVYHPNRKQISSKMTSLSTTFAYPNEPLQLKMWSAEDSTGFHRFFASWNTPEKNINCLNFYYVELFRNLDLGCYQQNCIKKKIFKQTTTDTQISIPIDEILCADYFLSVRANYGDYSINGSLSTLKFPLYSDNNVPWTNTRFSLMPSKVYFSAKINWTLPQPSPICFPQFKIKVCTDKECKDVPASLIGGVAKASELIPKTTYFVNFYVFNNSKQELIGKITFKTEDEIPSISNGYFTEIHYQFAELKWTIPNEILDEKNLLTLILQENNHSYEKKEIPIDKFAIKLTNLEPCWTYNFSLSIKYKEYFSKPFSTILKTPDIIDAIYSVRNLKATNVSPISLELSWDSQFRHCYSHFEVVYENRGITYTDIINSTKVEIKNLTPCNLYNFYIYTISRSGKRKQSDILQKTTLYKENKPVVNLTVVEKRTDGFFVKWKPPHTFQCIDSYVSYLYKVSGSTTQMVYKNDLKMNELSKNITGLNPCSTYLFKVISKWKRKEGEWGEITEDTLTEVPGKVMSLKTKVMGDDIHLNWEHPNELRFCVDVYEIYSHEMSSEINNKFMLHVNGSHNKAVIQNVTACTKYKISIRSTTHDGKKSEYISTVAQTPSAKINIKNGQVTNATSNYIQITWFLVESKCQISSFISFCENITVIRPTKSKEISSRVFVDEFLNLIPDTLYRCFAYVYNEAGISEKHLVFAQTTPKRNTFSNDISAYGLTKNSYRDLTHVTREKNFFKTRVRRFLVSFGVDLILKMLESNENKTPVPSEPTNARVLTLNTTAIYITWDPPKYIPSPLTGYLINLSNVKLNYYIPKHCNQTQIANLSYSVPANVTEHIISGLKPFTKVDVNIQATIGNESGLSSPMVNISTLPSVPEKVRFLRNSVEQNKTVISWYTPCLTNGVLSHFLASLYGVRRNHPPMPHKRWTIAVEETKAYYEIALTDLRPEYEYEINITAIVFNVTEGNPKTERFQWPAGIPPEPDMITSDISFTILSSSEVIMTFDYNVFNDSEGEIRYYALLLSASNFSHSPQSGWLGVNGSWPEEKNWAQAMSKSEVDSYQATPLLWYPFKDTLLAQYVLGQDSCSLANTVSFCNGPLLENTKYLLRIRGFTALGYRDTVSLQFTTEGSVSYVHVMFVSVTIVAVITVLMIIVLVVTGQLSRDACMKKPKKNEKVVGESHIGPKFLSAKKFLLHCNNILDNPGKMKEEYDLLIGQSTKLASPMTVAIEPQNKKKNRYINILPYDSNRVILKGDVDSSYINASYIKFHGEKPNMEFIACQAPKQEYSSDFWKMIFQCKVYVIIMLCNLVEKEKEKCCAYFPNLGETVTYNDVPISCISQTDHPYHILRVLNISENGVERTIYHFHFIEWPDFGVPSSSEAMLKFCQAVKVLTKGKEHIQAVHCSAGVGRTGTYIAMVVLLKHLKHNKKLNVFDIILQMRGQRPHMVQTMEQYTYIYQCLKYAIEHKRSGIRGLRKSAYTFISDLKMDKSVTNTQMVLAEKSIPDVPPVAESENSAI